MNNVMYSKIILVRHAIKLVNVRHMRSLVQRWVGGVMPLKAAMAATSF